ncbi:MAG: ribosome assembly RNA-binding protein YhbY [Desulfuromonadales bacterium]|nr:ribosome assembly RNA-binding protein YhbY [Desulfuromonadales bacterium]
MATKALTGKQARFLRGLGHHLNPIVMIGRGELSDAVLRSTDEALKVHELIKVRLQEGCELDRREVAAELAAKSGAQIAQILGKTFLLYREAEEKKIILP